MSRVDLAKLSDVGGMMARTPKKATVYRPPATGHRQRIEA